MDKRLYIIESLSQYWTDNFAPIVALPIPTALKGESNTLPPEVVEIRLPAWAERVGVDGNLLVPKYCVCNGNQEAWKRVDWLESAFWYLNNLAERELEKLKGPVHSYSFRLVNWDKRIWQRAWVNRIALFLRKWASIDNGLSEDALLGVLPETKILLTHDVDAIKKTLAIRLKQTLFHCFNAVRALTRGDLKTSIIKLAHSQRFFYGKSKYWLFEDLMEVERKYHKKSIFLFYGGKPSNQKSIVEWLFDPSYDPNDTSLKELANEMIRQGCSIGLHPSFTSWEDRDKLNKARENLERSFGIPIRMCRQHWLRFSFESTWRAQEDAMLTHDFTLSFNDISGLRNGAAITFHPWDFTKDQPMKLVATATVFMDSQFYDYINMTDDKRKNQIRYWLNEIQEVHGTAAILWHQHTFSDDYGWKTGYKEMLDNLKDAK